MNFDQTIKNDDLTIYCSNGLKDFSNDFVKYYKKNINYIKKELAIDDNINPIVILTDDETKANFTYGKSAFSGGFTNKGAFAYINLNSEKTEEYMYKGLMHELIHYLYTNYVYGIDKQRITWVDEGLAQLLSGQKEELKNEERYQSFIEYNLNNIDNIDLNELNHNDKSFGNNNGYNISYIAMRYLYETNTHINFIEKIRSKEKLLKEGVTVIKDAKDYYGIINKKI